MAKEKGRYLPITPFRRLVADLMHFSQRVPTLAVERKMNLAELIAARQDAIPRPSWSSIFSKAFSILSRDCPELRRSYLSFPWARLYEHPHTIATINVERMVERESQVIYCMIQCPESRSLAEIDELIRQHKEGLLDEVPSYQRAMSLARWPRFVRHLAWRVAINMIGSLRCHNFGTFGTSSVGAHGAGLLHLVPLLTATIYYGLFESDGALDVRLAWDHRIFDGALAARFLVDLEGTLNGEILREIKQLDHFRNEHNQFAAVSIDGGH